MDLNIVKNPKPFLRWAGGKTWLIKYLHQIFQDFHFNNYHEPFLGSGVVFLNVQPKKDVYLSDLNAELIDTFIAVKEDVEKVMDKLDEFTNSKEEYYRIRSSKFRNDFKKAARFIYLNQTSFNGIYRVNLQGEYNVPYGFRSTKIYIREDLIEISRRLSGASIISADFAEVSKKIKKHDLIFLDPPYTVTHNQNGFIKYNQKLFSIDDQYRLSELIDFIDKKGAYYIMSNADHKKIEEIFEKGHRRISLSRASLIGGINAKRGYYSELIFTNINPA